ncbi:MAG: WG repeat-containing protein [Bacteroidota bacterium]
MNKFLTLICAGFTLISGSLTAQDNLGGGEAEPVDPYTLFVPYKENKTSWGFKKNQQVAIPARFEYVTHFSEGYALVKSSGKWGYIDTLGAWYIEPEYDKGQPFQNGIAFVKKGNKTGLIGIEKNVIIEPVYDNIREDYSTYYLVNGGKWGVISREHPEFPAIPAIYDSIAYYNYDISSGKNSDGTWDIYFRGVKMLEKADQPVTYKNHHYSNDIVILSVNGKYGVHSLQSGWIIQPEYGIIEFLEFPDYKVKNDLASAIFALHDLDLPAYDPEYMYNDELKDSITLARINGELISTLKFNTISSRYDRYSEIQSPYAIELSRNGKTYQLMPDFRIKEFKFSNVVSHNYNTYFIADAESGSQYILDRNFNVIDSFYQVRKYVELMQDYENSGEIYDPETGEYLYEPNFMEQAVEEPFLVVYRKNGEKVTKALYDLQAKLVMSPWFEENQAITVQRSGIGSYWGLEVPQDILYSYYPEMDYGNPDNNAGKKMGYYVKGMKTGTEMIYHVSNGIPVTGNLFVMRDGDPAKPVHHLFRYADGKAELISSEYEIEESINIYGSGSEYSYDPETGEGLWDYVPTKFIHNFLVLKKDKKFGVACFNGTIFKPQYDTLLQNTSADFVINTLVNEKYGTIDLLRGYEIKPQFESEPYINSDLYSGNQVIYNTAVYDGTGSYMLDLRGRKFYGRPEMTFPRRVKRKFGLFAYSQSDMYQEPAEQVKATYRYLEQSFIPGVFLAQGKGKKWGMINFIGDTLVPVKYDKIRPFNYNGDNMFILEVNSKKKKGLYDMNMKEIVPCKYDEISQMGDYDIFYNVYEVKNKGKSGAVNGKGEELLPAVYDEVKIRYDYGSYLVGIKGNKTVALLITEDLKPGKLQEYDFLAGGKGYVKKADNYEVYDLLTNEFENTIPFDQLTLNGTMYNIIVRNGKFGAADFEGKELVPCIYDFATFMEFRDEVMIGYQNGTKYYIYVENNERFTEEQW